MEHWVSVKKPTDAKNIFFLIFDPGLGKHIYNGTKQIVRVNSLLQMSLKSPVVG